MRLKLLACEILYREICHVVASSTSTIDVEFLPKGLHDLGSDRMRTALSERLASVPTDHYDAIAMGYALCNNGVVGLRAPAIPLVLPRAHDCITLFLGSHARYQEVFNAHPGTYYKTSGWIERGDLPSPDDPAPQARTGLPASSLSSSIQQMTGINLSYEELADRYGEDNARYLLDQLTRMEHYDTLAFIEMGIEPDDRFERRARSEAERRGWEFLKLEGDLCMLRDLVDGNWDPDRYLVVSPTQSIAACFDDSIVSATCCQSGCEDPPGGSVSKCQ